MSIFGKYIEYLGKKAENDIENTVKKFISKSRNCIYLDCGCGDGRKTIKRANLLQTTNILGNEIISSSCKLARQKGIKILGFDLNSKWKIRSTSVDVITATEVIEHLVDLDNFFSEAKRVLKPRGKIILSTENLAAYHNIFALILGNQPYTGPYLSRKYVIGHRPNAYFYESGMTKTMFPHLNVMTAKSLEQLLVKHGFRLIRSKGVGFYPLPPLLWTFFNTIDKYHSSYIVTLAQK